jgi:hypothetical protein
MNDPFSGAGEYIGCFGQRENPIWFSPFLEAVWRIDPAANVPSAEFLSMGDNSPKNQHKLHEQKIEEHEKKDHEKLENAVHQHHPDRRSTPEELLALKKQEEEDDAAIEKAD